MNSIIYLSFVTWIWGKSEGASEIKIMKRPHNSIHIELAVPANFISPSGRLLKNAMLYPIQNERSVFSKLFLMHENVGVLNECKCKRIMQIRWSALKPFRDIWTPFHFYATVVNWETSVRSKIRAITERLFVCLFPCSHFSKPAYHSILH